MQRANDQIFQLSLTEIAFTLTFLLLLLLGWMLFQADERARQFEQALLAAGNVTAERELLETARAQLAKTLSEKGAKPDDIISSLVSQSKLVQERDALKKRVDDLDAQLSALTEVKNTLDAARAGTGASDTIQKEVTDALALKAKLKKQLKAEDKSGQPASAVTVASGPTRPSAPRDVTTEALAGVTLKGQIQQQLREQLDETYIPGQEAQLAKQLVAASKFERETGQNPLMPGTLKKENADLRGQVAFLKARLDARGGRDYPPCWANEQTGKVEFLFTIEILPEGLLITPAWPDTRQTDAAALPDVDKLTMAKPLSLAEFSAAMQGIDRLSKAKECRHYVYLKNRVRDLDSFNRHRYAIENFFYKLELRS
ncbi:MULTISPECIES: hypothetical protein [Paraburkholderia]|uniref:hypothetical protein n=1 Tax=Paraburkholderia TaxID=1822464 RepID=UPI00225103AE|nr:MULTISPECIES: hypothetical protein [Paraburkholderia]MCX4176697.1 hypothetical protein [Paraburkholderia madseniana]MDQ6464688.1 hypothetical protein [Paraburkholderia madseniana]